MPEIFAVATLRNAARRWLTPSLLDLFFAALLLAAFTQPQGLWTLRSDGDTSWPIRTGELVLESLRNPYGGQLHPHIVRYLKSSESTWQELMERYRFELALLPRNWLSALDREPGRRRIDEDSVAVLHARIGGAEALAGAGRTRPTAAMVVSVAQEAGGGAGRGPGDPPYQWASKAGPEVRP